MTKSRIEKRCELKILIMNITTSLFLIIWSIIFFIPMIINVSYYRERKELDYCLVREIIVPNLCKEGYRYRITQNNDTYLSICTDIILNNATILRKCYYSPSTTYIEFEEGISKITWVFLSVFIAFFLLFLVSIFFSTIIAIELFRSRI